MVEFDTLAIIVFQNLLLIDPSSFLIRSIVITTIGGHVALDVRALLED